MYLRTDPVSFGLEQSPFDALYCSGFWWASIARMDSRAALAIILGFEGVSTSEVVASLHYRGSYIGSIISGTVSNALVSSFSSGSG